MFALGLAAALVASAFFNSGGLRRPSSVSTAVQTFRTVVVSRTHADSGLSAAVQN